MKKYILRTGEGAAFNAASKARRDADAIALRLGYEPFHFRGARTADRSPLGAIRLALAGLSNWRRLIADAERDSLVLVQYPHYPMKSAYLSRWMLPRAQRKKGLRFIALIHDLDSLRGLHGHGAAYSDRNLLPRFDAIICHNERMADYLAKQGIPRDRLVTLELFDYLTDSDALPHRRDGGVAIAGNLSPEKCGYVRDWIDKADGSTTLHLYGKGLENVVLPEWVQLHGAFPPEVLPAELTGGFGLVWDGPSAGTCAGPAGEYLRVNNPHKFSLYMAAGLPVVIWSQAALADFARSQGVGIAVDGLDHLAEVLNAISEEDYANMCRNSEITGKRVRSGAHLESALRRAEQIVDSQERKRDDP